jgi:hypothetical protein
MRLRRLAGWNRRLPILLTIVGNELGRLVNPLARVGSGLGRLVNSLTRVSGLQRLSCSMSPSLPVFSLPVLTAPESLNPLIIPLCGEKVSLTSQLMSTIGPVGLGKGISGEMSACSRQHLPLLFSLLALSCDNSLPE